MCCKVRPFGSKHWSSRVFVCEILIKRGNGEWESERKLNRNGETETRFTLSPFLRFAVKKR